LWSENANVVPVSRDVTLLHRSGHRETALCRHSGRGEAAIRNLLPANVKATRADT
jgi:hypothetical protein